MIESPSASQGIREESAYMMRRRSRDAVRGQLRAFAAKYFVRLSDEEAEEWLRRRAGKDDAEARQIVSGYRRGAQEHEVPDRESCHIHVVALIALKGPFSPAVTGPTLKRTIPYIGLCANHFRYLQDWDLPDPPVQECILSLIPTLLRDSTYKRVEEQRALLAQVRPRLALPESHLTEFGSATHLAGAALSYEAAGRNIFAGKRVLTETCTADGLRLYLNREDWNAGQLHCGLSGNWRDRDLGVLACGVEKALGR